MAGSNRALAFETNGSNRSLHKSDDGGACPLLDTILRFSPEYSLLETDVDGKVSLWNQETHTEYAGTADEIAALLLGRILNKAGEAERRFHDLAENIGEIFFFGGPDGTPVHYVSPAYEHITGRKCQTLYENPFAWLDDIDPADRTRVQDALRNSLDTFDEEYQIVRSGGQIRHVHTRAFPVKNDSGKTIRIVGIAEDITERKLAQEKNRLQAAALEATANGIVITDSAGTIQWVNPAFNRLTGYSTEEAVGQNPRLWDPLESTCRHASLSIL